MPEATRKKRRSGRYPATIHVQVDDIFDTTDGWCLECGEQHAGHVEPDVRLYECAYCGKSAVFGVEQIAIEAPECLCIHGESGE